MNAKRFWRFTMATCWLAALSLGVRAEVLLPHLQVLLPEQQAPQVSTDTTWSGPPQAFNMVDMLVTAYFEDGFSESALWTGIAATPGPDGRAEGGEGWVVENLTDGNHTFWHEWTATYPGGPHGAINALELDGLHRFKTLGIADGNTVFDRFDPPFTPGTEPGREFETNNLENFQIQATYHEPVRLVGEAPQFDIWGTLRLDFKNKVEPKWQQRFEPDAGENVPSSVDWRRIMIDPSTLDTAVADDFISNGRPITSVRWWGSYFNPEDQPTQPNPEEGEVRPYQPRVEEAYLISFFEAGGTAGPGTLLGSYVAPAESLAIQPTGATGWDGHEVWRYDLRLEDSILDHTEFPELAQPDGFYEEEGSRYWISIAAADGHEFDPDSGEFFDNGDPERQDPFWGWHTSPEENLDDPVQSPVAMPDEDVWRYSPWSPVNLTHPDPNSSYDMAFELFFTEAGTAGLDGTNSLTFWQDTDTIEVVPEPSSVLLCIAAATLTLLPRRLFSTLGRQLG